MYRGKGAKAIPDITVGLHNTIGPILSSAETLAFLTVQWRLRMLKSLWELTNLRAILRVREGGREDVYHKSFIMRNKCTTPKNW